MISTMVRSRIETALTAADGAAEFKDRMERMAEAQGVDLTPDEHASLVAFGADYVRGAVRLLQSCDAAAGQARAQQLVSPVLEAASGFFLKYDQNAPYSAGLYGALCNAFAAREVIARASERLRGMRGIPLLASEPHPEKDVAEAMIGADVVTILNAMIDRAVDTAEIRHALMNNFRLQGALTASPNVDAWSAGWETEVTRFGASIGIDFQRRPH